MVNDMNYEDIKTPEELLQYMNDNFRYGFIAEDGTEYNMDDPDKFTENFSELFVESFIIRYLSSFDNANLISDYNKAKIMLIERINKKFLEKTKKEA